MAERCPVRGEDIWSGAVFACEREAGHPGEHRSGFIRWTMQGVVSDG